MISVQSITTGYVRSKRASKSTALFGRTKGALEIQNYLELLEWFHAVGDPIPFAPHLRLSPLTGVPEKRLPLQIARGDLVIPNPANSNLIRHAGGQGSTVLYRHDIARQNSSEALEPNPHEFLFAPPQPPPLLRLSVAVAAAAQTQIAGFFASDGMLIPEANSAALEALFRGNKVFERPTSLPEDLGFSVLPNSLSQTLSTRSSDKARIHSGR